LEMTALSEGNPTIRLERILFGTRDGRGIQPGGAMELTLVCRKPWAPGNRFFTAVSASAALVCLISLALLKRRAVAGFDRNRC
jgi:hypothetical protein